MSDEEEKQYFRGRGAQLNPHNKFLKDVYVKEHDEGIDDWEETDRKTTFVFENSKTIVNKVDSPDVGMAYSLNPYQGCEHGCTYCYARNSHQYWGYSAGLDFERKIIVKKDAPTLFKKFLEKKGWDAATISLSGNTDCYQPAERKFKLTRQLLEIALEYKQPIGMITKNALILRDLDILQEMARQNLCMVYVSINSLNETLRQLMEPRTTTAKQRLKVVDQLSKAGIPVGVMVAPLVPGLSDHEIPKILKSVADAGAVKAGYTIVRLNGAIGQIFEDWLHKNFPDRFDKVWHMIQSCHGGNVNDSRFGDRMRGEGNIAKMIKDNFKLHCRLNGLNTNEIILDHSLFKVPSDQMSLF
ncbi:MULTISPECIES: PA0069 family radical SAM protein [unclassified Pedobacter]|jgi:DNA repair photolyase|uniref:PA0069 family radical SAM protein n=1 Tax=unclassified Pedobacter TaxID=2628915 RepID=UPI000B4C157F|nr:MULTISPECIES: PA0069 family radical SAM protein [unclassified Pedobacter]MCX2433486.1 PA0069 family radical SAM protein [Pedobacter sp. GR22-10]OWK68696.1 radical SAM protein [Pedobacter sp. AJM]